MSLEAEDGSVVPLTSAWLAAAVLGVVPASTFEGAVKIRAE